MASIIISGDTLKDVPEVRKMVNDLLKGNIGISQFFKFLHDNNLETKVNCINKDVEPSVLDDFIGDTLCNIFCYKKSEHEDTENYIEDEENDECNNHDEFWKKTNEAYEKHVKDTVDFAKRLIDDYGDSEEDDIDHAKAVKLFHSLILLARTYRQRASGGDERYNIPNFVPENILKFIESLDLPTDKIKATSERGKSTHYKMKNYKSFEEFEKNMKYAYGIENVWKPTKEVPEWFESVRNMLYRKFYPTEDILIDESEWNEFKKWKEENDKNSSINNTVGKCDISKSCDEECTCIDKKNDNKDSFEDQCRHIVNDIINEFSPVFTIKVIRYFEKKYKSNDKIFMYRLKELYNTVKSAKNNGLMSFIDIVHDKDICCSFVPIAREDIKGKPSNVSSKPDLNPEEDPINYKKTLEALNEINEIISDSLKTDKTTEKKNTTSAKKSSTSKKTTVSASVKTDKTQAKKTTTKPSKTDTVAKLKEFKGYSDYILLNSVVKDDAKDLLLSYAANMNERCKDLYKNLIDLKRRHKSVKLVRHYDENTGFEDLVFVDLID